MSLKIPEGWHEISVDEFLEIHQNKIDDEKTFFETQVALLGIICGVEDEYFDELYVDELNELISSIKWVKSQPSEDFSNIINEYYFKPLNKITVGEFLDVQHFLAEDYYKNLSIICSILYKKQKVSEFGNIIWEPYGEVDIWDRAKYFNNMPITGVFGIINHFIKWREEIMTIYKNIFNPIIEEDEDYEPTPEDLIEEEKEKELEKFSWQFLLDELANYDITKIDTITDLPLIQVLNYLTQKKINPNKKGA